MSVKNKFVLGRAKKIVGKGENAGNRQYFQNYIFFIKVVKSQDCVVKGFSFSCECLWYL